MTSPFEAIVATAQAAAPERWTVGPIIRRDLLRFAVLTGDELFAAGLIGGGCQAPPMYLTSVLDWGTGEVGERVRADGLSPREAPHVGDHDVRVVHGGQQLRWYRPLLVGAGQLVAERHVRRAAVRSGRAGPLAVLDLETRFTEVGRGVLTRCRETILCLDPQAPPHADVRPVGESDPEARFDVEDRYDERRMLRFSAVTWNSHRIHVDSDVARREGFAGPVVHSTLHGMLLLRAAMAATGGAAFPDEFGWRNLAPATAGERLRAVATPIADDAHHFELVEWAEDGVVTARGTARSGPMDGPRRDHENSASRDTEPVRIAQRGTRS